MIVILEDSFFTPVPSFVQLSFIGVLKQSRHSVMALNPASANFIAWKNALAADALAAYELLEEIAVLQSTIPSASAVGKIRVGAGVDQLSAKTPFVCVETALKILRHPIYLFLENSYADKNFLRAFMSDVEKIQFMQKLESGDIRLVHGGGLGDLKRQMKEIASAIPLELRKFLCVVLIDSDAVQPGVASSASEKVLSEAQSLGLSAVFQLKRRAIENYLTESALSLWCYKAAGNSKKYSKCLRSFRALSKSLKFHFHMKKGLKGDDAKHVAKMYGKLSSFHYDALENGFGEKVSQCYQEEGWVVRTDLVQDGGWAELRTPVEKLLAMV